MEDTFFRPSFINEVGDPMGTGLQALINEVHRSATSRGVQARDGSDSGLTVTVEGYINRQHGMGLESSPRREFVIEKIRLLSQP